MADETSPPEVPGGGADPGATDPAGPEPHGPIVPSPVGRGGEAFDPLLGTGGSPIGAPAGAGPAPLGPERIWRSGQPIGGESSRFSGGSAPVALLGLVWTGGLPLSGPVPQVFRAGGAPIPPTLHSVVRSQSPSGPIGAFLLGSSGAPIGGQGIRGGGLPIDPAPPAARALAAVPARTAPAPGLAGGRS